MLSALRPIHRAALTSATFMAAGDVACQVITTRHAPTKLDTTRTARFAIVGLTLHGPFFYKGFQWLDRRFGAHANLQTAVTKALVGQLTLFPTFNCLFLLYTGLLEGLPPAEAPGRLRDRLPNLLLVGSVYWPLVNVANFALLTPGQRVLGMNVASLAWNTYMSFAAGGSGGGQAGASGGGAAACAAADGGSGGGGGA